MIELNLLLSLNSQLINPPPPLHRIYVSLNWVNIGSDDGLLPVGHKAITWINADLLSIGSLGTNFNDK